MGEPRETTRAITVHLPKSLADVVEREAWDAGRSISGMARLLIALGLCASSPDGTVYERYLT